MATDTTPPTDGVYWIRNIGTRTVIELKDGSNANSMITCGYQQRALSDEMVPAQLWVISQSGSDKSVFKIENANSRTIMDLAGSNPANGTPIIGYQSNGNPNQRWAILRNSNDTAYVIQNQATNTYVNLLNGASANGTAINGYSGDAVGTTTHQLWELVRA